MIKSNQLINILTQKHFNFITGIPCSILRDFLIYINETNKIKHIPAVNESEACAIASGYYLSTKKIPIVYMQNSGLGNSVDTMTSLFNKEVYNIPVLLLISWRGQPGGGDQPQHLKMGKIMLKLLEIMDIPYSLLPTNIMGAKRVVKKARQYFKKNDMPYAIIIRKGIIEPCPIRKRKKNIYPLTREEAIRIVVDNLRGNEIIISTTGKTSRELFEYRERKKQRHKTDFYTVGSMGCSAGIALGVAIGKPRKKIIVFDGDGSVLMAMGTLASIGHFLPQNFFHIIFDNNAYGSTGGQRTVSDSVDFSKIALACGYREAKTVLTRKTLIRCLKTIKLQKGPCMMVIKVRKGARGDLGRLTKTPQEIKIAFMKFIIS